MTLILMRHATRDFNDDDGLSTEGHRLATTLASVLRGDGVVPTRLYSSPKKRTRATLRPISEELGLSVSIDARLDERDHQEAVQEFENRILDFTEEALKEAGKEAGKEAKTSEQAEPVWVACSHLDWLEEAAAQLPSDENDFERAEPWSPMAIRIYVFEDGIWKRKKRSK